MMREGGAMTRLALALLFGLAASPVFAGPVDRSFTITDFDRIRLDGPFKVEVATNVPPYARARGSSAALDGVSIAVQGRTLVIRPNPSAWGGYPGTASGPVEITVGTHGLNSAWLNGSGQLAIDRIKGLIFGLSVQGAGSARVADAKVDQLQVGLSGSGSVTIAGTAPKLVAIVRGTSVLDGSGLRVSDAVLGADGAPTLRLEVSRSAKIDAKGLAVVELGGRPACQVKNQGSATVSGCR